MAEEILSFLSGGTGEVPLEPIHRQFENKLAAGSYANNVAVYCDCGESITFSELNNKANLLARRLCQVLPSKVKTIPCIAVMMPPSAERIITLIAILKTGAAYVPLDWNFPIKRTKYMIEIACPDAIIVLEKEASTFPALDIQIISFENLVTEVATYDYETSNILDAEQLTANKSADDIFTIMFSSGTTGPPKGTLISHRNISNGTTWFDENFSMQKGDIGGHMINYLSIASPLEIFTCLLRGIPLAIVPDKAKLDPNVFIDVLDTMKITVLFSCPPSLLRNTCTEVRKNGHGLENLRIAGTGSEIIPGSLVRDFMETHSFRKELVTIYGMTETTCYSMTEKFSSEADFCKIVGSKVAFGKPTKNMNFYIVNKSLKLLPSGETGEIAVSGFGVAMGYLKNKVNKNFVSNPFPNRLDTGFTTLLLTGDYGIIKGDQLYFVGRESTRVKVRGYRVSTVEVESSMYRLKGIKRAAVIAHQVERDSDNVILVGYYTAESHVSPEQMLQHLKNELPDYAVPRIFQLDEMPLRLPTEKINYPELKEIFNLYLKQIQSTLVDGKEASCRELALNSFCEVLGICKNDIDLKANFFDIGGNSLNLTLLWNKLNENDIDVGIQSLLHAKSIQHILDLCSRQVLDESDSLTRNPLQKSWPTYFVLQKLHDQTDEKDGAMLVANAYAQQRNVDLKKTWSISFEAAYDFVFSALPLARKENLSLCIRDTRTKKFAAVSLLTSFNPDAQLGQSSYSEWDDKVQSFILEVEKPYMKEEKEKGYRTLWGTRFGVNPTANAIEAPLLTEMMIIETIRFAKENAFQKFHLTTTHSFVRRQMLSLGAEIKKEIEAKEFVYKGKKILSHAAKGVYISSIVYTIQ